MKKLRNPEELEGRKRSDHSRCSLTVVREMLFKIIPNSHKSAMLSNLQHPSYDDDDMDEIFFIYTIMQSDGFKHNSEAERVPFVGTAPSKGRSVMSRGIFLATAFCSFGMSSTSPSILNLELPLPPITTKEGFRGITFEVSMDGRMAFEESMGGGMTFEAPMDLDRKSNRNPCFSFVTVGDFSSATASVASTTLAEKRG